MQNRVGLFMKVCLIIVVFFAAFVAAVMFPAGTIHFWQGWLCCAAFCLPTLFITLYLGKHDPALLERRVSPVELRTQQKWMQSIAGLLFFLGLLVLPGLDHRFSWSHVPTPFTLCADALIIMGFIIVFFVFKSNSFTSRAVEVMQAQKIVTSGPYGVVRHPMYSGAMLIVVGLPISLDSLWGLIPAGLVCAIIVMRLLDEEMLLIERLDGYAAYSQTVRWRLIPFVW